MLDGLKAAGEVLSNLFGHWHSVHQHQSDLQWSEVDYFLQARQLFVDIFNNIRDDLQDVHEKDERKLDTNLLVGTLMLGFGFGFACEGTFPPDESVPSWDVYIRMAYVGSAACSLVLPFLATVGLLESRRRLDVYMRMFNEKFNLKIQRANRKQTTALTSARLMSELSRGSTLGLPTTLIGSWLRHSWQHWGRFRLGDGNPVIRCCSRRRVPVQRLRAERLDIPQFDMPEEIVRLFNSAVDACTGPGTIFDGLPSFDRLDRRDDFGRYAKLNAIKTSRLEVRKQVTGYRVVTGHWWITPGEREHVEDLLQCDDFMMAVRKIVQYIWTQKLRNAVRNKFEISMDDVSVNLAWWTESTIHVIFAINIDRFNDGFTVKASYFQWRYVHVDCLESRSERLLLAGIFTNVTCADLLLALYFQHKFPDTPAAPLVYSGIVSCGLLLFIVWHCFIRSKPRFLRNPMQEQHGEASCEWARMGRLPRWAERVDEDAYW